jgi:hypothetical protein
MKRTMTAAATINPALLATLKGKPEDENSDIYRRLKRIMMATRLANADCRFVYVSPAPDNCIPSPR